jgi:hypothetical protein
MVSCLMMVMTSFHSGVVVLGWNGNSDVGRLVDNHGILSAKLDSHSEPGEVVDKCHESLEDDVDGVGLHEEPMHLREHSRSLSS